MKCKLKIEVIAAIKGAVAVGQKCSACENFAT
jgi:hypothetical protein